MQSTPGEDVLGSRGENVAARFLQGLGYNILVRNFRCAVGEIDIIAREGRTLVFVEVKTREADDPMPEDQINADKQQATVRSAEASRAGTQADVEYWTQQVKRLESLVSAGAISRQEFDQAQNQLRTAEARLAALDAQVREGRVELQYYRVDAPQAGIVGDIPIRTGDRVTTSTVITTPARCDEPDLR